MLGYLASALGRLAVVGGVFLRLAPRAGDAEIFPLIGAAVFEGDNVLNDVVVGWT